MISLRNLPLTKQTSNFFITKKERKKERNYRYPILQDFKKRKEKKRKISHSSRVSWTEGNNLKETLGEG